MGVERSLEKMRKAGLVVYLFDCSTESLHELRTQVAELESINKNYLLVGNKVDMMSEAQAVKKFAGMNILLISAKTHYHVDELKQILVHQVLQGELDTESTIITNTRHYAALQEVARSLADIRQGLDSKISGDLLAPDIRRCLHFLGEITGEITNEDRLNYIFSKFCIGK